ncbi:MAG: D-alanyl-D-alanine carboxypeptidase [Clostridia bacterium]|nr:D-alanyl-D-alanine carboxypeptidase [Clostridia bacterium]
MDFYKRTGTLLLCIFFFWAAEPHTSKAAEINVPTLNAPYAFVQNLETGRVLYEKSASVKVPMASTTKIMTAMIVSRHCSLTETVTVSAAAAGTSGSSMHLTAGEKISVRALLYGLMLVSGNDAAVALAEHTSGSTEAFCRLMNEKAAELNCTNTHFTSPHGLDDEDHYTTAEDLGRIARAYTQDPLLSDICNTKLITIEGHTLTNTNPLLGVSPHVSGMKTGYTGNAGYCLVVKAQHGGASYIIVLLGCPTSKARRRDAFSMTNYVVEQYRLYQLYPKGHVVGTVQIQAGKMDEMDAVLSQNVQCLLKPEERDQIREDFIPMKTSFSAPLSHQVPVGTFRLFIGEELLLETPVVPFKTVTKKNFWHHFLDVLTAWIYLFE